MARSDGKVTIPIEGGSAAHRVVSHSSWLAARRKFLAIEKRFTRQRDELAEARRKLPWERLDKRYIFDGPGGKESLADLFGKHRQLLVYHFMFGPDWPQGCAHCSFWAEHYDAMGIFLEHRDTAFVVVSQAPLAKIKAFKKRMGWKFKWISSGGNDFNFDLGVAFGPEQLESGKRLYNYGTGRIKATDREGASAFYKHRGVVYHTYSTYERGIDLLNTTYNWLDLTAKGRNEGNRGQFWVKFRDGY